MKKNHLKNEKSYYLQQHASNPIKWFPWGEKAKEKVFHEVGRIKEIYLNKKKLLIERGIKIICIGSVEKGKGVNLKNFNLSKVKKFDHFKNNYSDVLYLLLLIIITNNIGRINVKSVTTINKIPSSE